VCESEAPPKDVFQHGMVVENVNSVKARSIFFVFIMQKVAFISHSFTSDTKENMIEKDFNTNV